MALIDETYFDMGDLLIPNTDKVAVQEKLQWYIDYYEPALLKSVFGYELYKAFTAGLADPTPDQKWIDLRDGKDYTYNGRARRWEGLRYTVGEASKSFIANYVYYYFVRSEATQTVGLGEVATKAENAVRVSPATKMARAWNEMSEWISELAMFLTTERETYPEWDHQDLCELRKYAPINTLGI